MKRRIALFLAVCLFIGSPFMAFAAKPEVTGSPVDVITPLYLNLGDSIAYGMSAEPGKSYFDLFADYLKVGPAMNLGVPGATTGDLLTALNTRQYQRAVQRADIITISIGGNNLLGPIRERVAAVFGAANMMPDLENPMEIKAAIAAIAAAESQVLGYDVTPEQVWHTITTRLIMEAGNDSTLLNAALTSGFNAFRDDLPFIIDTIHTINPQATVIVFTLYNPVKEQESPGLYELFKELSDPMNGLIKSFGMMGNIYALDVYDAFDTNPSAVAFSLAWDTLNLDPHPTTTGHQIIFQELMKLGNVRAFQPGKPEGVGKASDEMAEELQVNNVGGLPAAHEVTGAEFGELVAETVQEDPALLADHASSSVAGLPAAHEDELGDPLSGYGFGQAVSVLAGENPSR